jgi:hypothetical protein
MATRRAVRLVQLSGAVLLMGAACDGVRLPALRARDSTLVASAPAATPPAKPNRAPKTASAKVDPALDAERFNAIRRGLRRLVAAEETYYAENGIYTDDMARLNFAPEKETEIRFLWVTRTGWAVSGSHPGMPGRDCVIYVGRGHGAPTTLHDVREGREGVPVCDGASRQRRAPVASTTPSASPSTTSPTSPAAAQPSSPGPVASAEPAQTDTGSALDLVDPRVQMRVDLRNLVRSQDSWYGTQGVYSRRTDPFALQYLWHRGVKITILNANSESWSARATHASRPGKSCVIWLGPVPQLPVTEAQKKTPDKPAVPACDD